jgi:hypothetical protein
MGERGVREIDQRGKGCLEIASSPTRQRHPFHCASSLRLYRSKLPFLTCVLIRTKQELCQLQVAHGASALWVTTRALRRGRRSRRNGKYQAVRKDRAAWQARPHFCDDEPMPLICPTCQIPDKPQRPFLQQGKTALARLGGKPQSDQGRSSDLASANSRGWGNRTIFASPYTGLTARNRKIEL